LLAQPKSLRSTLKPHGPRRGARDPGSVVRTKYLAMSYLDRGII
jgi:hypothetical protein